jgi:ketosteroid isomerase-like protein
MSAAITIADRQAIEALVNEHAWLIDHGRADEVAQLYLEDGRLLGIGPPRTSRAAILEWACQRAAMRERKSRHVQTNLRLEPCEDASVKGTTVVTLYRHDGGGVASPTPFLVGEFADHFRRDATGNWRFAERSLSILFGSA